jgi:hypothetical protein
MNFEYRLLLYVLSVFAGTIGQLIYLFQHVKHELITDPSAGAILGFWPYLVPIFFVMAVVWVAPVAAIIEVVIGIWRWVKS